MSPFCALPDPVPNPPDMDGSSPPPQQTDCHNEQTSQCLFETETHPPSRTHHRRGVGFAMKQPKEGRCGGGAYITHLNLQEIPNEDNPIIVGSEFDDAA
ncbi:hypothetical protein VTP01DRAFT_10430, partial [Rhizomucor pusillus]|uniref:uncharacterized protein n=1 Tax=Rhizomucor pusillus TaxID=4840 RepID=UPI00374364A7